MAHRIRNQSGFTLLEMIVVVAILATVAGIGVMSLGGATQATNEQLARAEMANIANAIRRFRADTGYWPKEGPFAGDDADFDTSGNAVVTDLPASFSQLMQPPFDDADGDLSTTGDQSLLLPFDPATGTGWNGPYINELQAVKVSVGDDLFDDGTSFSGVADISSSLVSGNIRLVTGLGDPFTRARRNDGLFFVWRLMPRAGDNPAEMPSSEDRVDRLGSPYLYFIDGGANANITSCIAPCIVSMGPNGAFEQGDGDDIVFNISANF